MGNTVGAQRKYLYGITQKEYAALLEKQHGKCAVCGDGETKVGRTGNTRSLCVDHCHTTGVIRGLLCDRCNCTLGKVKDDANLLRRMAAYIEVAEAKYSKHVASNPINDLLDD